VIPGLVTRDRQAIVRLRLRGPQGLEVEVDAVLDTGFTEYLALPRAWTMALGLHRLFTDRLMLADGSAVSVDLYDCIVDWDGQQRTIVVHCLEGSPLLGMSLLYDYLLTMEVVDGGTVTIDAIP
jgi:clan AA aspartic protease